MNKDGVSFDSSPKILDDQKIIMRKMVTSEMPGKESGRCGFMCGRSKWLPLIAGTLSLGVAEERRMLATDIQRHLQTRMYNGAAGLRPVAFFDKTASIGYLEILR
jgi:hypothetical protein